MKQIFYLYLIFACISCTQIPTIESIQIDSPIAGRSEIFLSNDESYVRPNKWIEMHNLAIGQEFPKDLMTTRTFRYPSVVVMEIKNDSTSERNGMTYYHYVLTPHFDEHKYISDISCISKRKLAPDALVSTLNTTTSFDIYDPIDSHFIEEDQYYISSDEYPIDGILGKYKE